jgi:hypothetical protein
MFLYKNQMAITYEGANVFFCIYIHIAVVCDGQKKKKNEEIFKSFEVYSFVFRIRKLFYILRK